MRCGSLRNSLLLALEGATQGVVDFIEMSDVTGDVAAIVVAFLAADTTNVLAADATAASKLAGLAVEAGWQES